MCEVESPEIVEEAEILIGGWVRWDESLRPVTMGGRVDNRPKMDS